MKIRKIFLFALVMLASCSKMSDSTDPSEMCGQRYPLSVSVRDFGTKITSDSGETSCKLLTVCVYRADGSLDAFAQRTNADSLHLNCTSLASKVYVIVNHDPTAVSLSSAALLAKTVSLDENAPDSLIMVGSSDVSLPGNETLTVGVKRLVSRVVVKSIKRRFPAGSLASLGFKVKRVYLKNVPANMNLGLSSAPTVFKNTTKGVYKDSPLLYDEISSEIANGASYDTPHYLYSCPRSGEMSLRTRLVIEASLGNTDYYYPVDLPETMSPNCSYEISDLVISRPGSDDPDEPVSSGALSFSLAITPWKISDMGEVTI